MLWDLLQQFDLDKQRRRSSDLTGRVTHLERELAETRALLKTLMERLEQRLGEDIDGDGQVGQG